MGSRPPAPATTWTSADRRDHLRAMLADLTASPPRRQFTRTAKQTTWSPYLNAGKILRRLEAGTTECPSPQDNWEMLEPVTPDGTDIGKNEYCAIRVTLRNTGAVPWQGRLLSRLGVTVSTVMPLTPRVVSVPDTKPGDSCSGPATPPTGGPFTSPWRQPPPSAHRRPCPYPQASACRA